METQSGEDRRKHLPRKLKGLFCPAVCVIPYPILHLALYCRLALSLAARLPPRSRLCKQIRYSAAVYHNLRYRDEHTK